MFYYESESRDPCWNLALEEYLFTQTDPDSSFFILWQNDKSVIIGRNQNLMEEVNQEYADRHSIQVVRRLTGGGAVYHDSGNLNYTFIVPAADDLADSFRQFSLPVIRALEGFGIKAELSGRNDILIDGKKISGCAECVQDGRVFHHGCILLDSSLDVLQNVLRVKEAKFQSKSIRSVRGRVTTINAHAPQKISMQEFRDALRKQVFSGSNDMAVYKLREDACAQIRLLAEEKYASRKWNYGDFPSYSMQRTHRFESGLVSVCLKAERGRIRHIRISGDFFGNKEITELERALEGLPLDDRLETGLRSLPIGDFILGISPEELAWLLR